MNGTPLLRGIEFTHAPAQAGERMAEMGRKGKLERITTTISRLPLRDPFAASARGVKIADRATLEVLSKFAPDFFDALRRDFSAFVQEKLLWNLKDHVALEERLAVETVGSIQINFILLFETSYGTNGLAEQDVNEFDIGIVADSGIRNDDGRVRLIRGGERIVEDFPLLHPLL